MKTIVAGSRDNVTLDNVRQAMLEAPFEITEVVSGTAHMINLAKQKGLHIFVYNASEAK